MFTVDLSSIYWSLLLVFEEALGTLFIKSFHLFKTTCPMFSSINFYLSNVFIKTLHLFNNCICLSNVFHSMTVACPIFSLKILIIVYLSNVLIETLHLFNNCACLYLNLFECSCDG